MLVWRDFTNKGTISIFKRNKIKLRWHGSPPPPRSSDAHSDAFIVALKHNNITPSATSFWLQKFSCMLISMSMHTKFLKNLYFCSSGNRYFHATHVTAVWMKSPFERVLWNQGHFNDTILKHSYGFSQRRLKRPRKEKKKKQALQLRVFFCINN